MDRQLKKRMKEVVLHIACIGQDGYGDKEFAPAVQYNGYMSGEVTKIINLDGEEDISQLQVILDGKLTITGNDEFNINSEPLNKRVKSYSFFRGLKDGTGTTVVYL